MTKFLIASIAFAAALGLAACSPKAQNETAEAADTIAADANATMSEAAGDTEAAADRALGAAETSIDNAGNAVGNAADSTLDATGNTLKKVGRDIED